VASPFLFECSGWVLPVDHDTAIKSYAVERYFLCELNEAERDAYEAHFFSCRACSEQVRLVYELIQAVREIVADARKARMKASDLKSYGAVLLCPGHPGFEAGVDLALRRKRSKFVNETMNVSVVLQNTAAKTIIGYSVNWEYKSAGGKTFTRGVVRDDPAALLNTELGGGTGGTDPSTSWSIEPGGALLVSVFTGVGKSEPDVTRWWRTEYVEEITSLISRSLEVTAILDGVMFEDGTFAGPNNNRLFERIVAAFDAVQGFYQHIVGMAGNSDLEEELVSWARAQLSDTIDAECGSHCSVDSDRILLDRIVAAENFVRIYEKSGLGDAVSFARSKLYCQRPDFVNLGC
jgi:hypothetical protein